MDKLKTHYDRFLALAAGLLLLGAAFYAVTNRSSLADSYPVPPAVSQGEKFESNATLTLLQTEAPKLDSPGKSSWKEDERSLFVSRIYLLRDGQLVDIFQSDKELVPGIPNKWILEHKLDYTNRNLADSDSDNDGFSNVEEFRAGTNPTDAGSKPAVWSKLRLASSKIEKLRTKFEALPNGAGDLKVVQINTVSPENPDTLTGASKFYKPGDHIVLSETDASGRLVETKTPLNFSEAKLVDVFNKKTNSKEQVPQITLVSSVDGGKIELLQGEVKDSPYSLATLQDTRSGGQSYDLREGQEFELEPGLRYKLIDVSEEAAKIQDLSTGETLPPIPRLQTDATTQTPAEP